MDYNIDFCILSLIYISTITIYCFLKRQVTETREVLLRSMLIVSIVGLIGDIVTALLHAYSTHFPASVIYIANFVSLGAIQLAPVLFFVYSSVLSGWALRFRKSRIFIFYLPYIVNLIILLMAPFTKNGIYYLNDDNSYSAGPIHFFLYISAAFYLTLSLCSVVLAKKEIPTKKRIVVIFFLLVVTAIISIQFVFTNILVNTTAFAYGLCILFLTMHSADGGTEQATSAIDSRKFFDVVADLFEQGQTFDIVIYSQCGFRFINSAFGVKTGNDVLAFISDLLKKISPHSRDFSHGLGENA